MKKDSDRLVPGFRTVAEGRDAQIRKARNEPSPLYPRDGGPLLGILEGRVAGLFGIEPQQTLLYPNGVTAVQQAVELAHPSRGTTALFADEMYSQNAWYMKTELPERGVTTVPVDAGSIDSIRRAVIRHRPGIMLLETVGNASEMKVLPVRQLLALPELADIDPLIVLDNSLTTPANLPLMEMAAESGLRVLITESGTKYTGMNEEAMGVTYSPRIELIKELRSRRPRTGTTPSSLAAQERWMELMPETKADFDTQVMGTTRNTFSLARVSVEVGSPYLSVVYPNLPTHPNYDLAEEMFPQGAAPVMFFHVHDWMGVDKFDVLEQFEKSKTVMDHAIFGQSFGFDHTRIWWEDEASIIRVAGGMETPEQMAVLAPAFQEALDSVGKPRRYFVNSGEGEEPVRDHLLKYGVEGQLKISGVPMEQPEDCAKACLRSLGHDGEKLPDTPMGYEDLVDLGIKARLVEVDDLETVSKEHPLMMLGLKTVTEGTNGQAKTREFMHWVLTAGDEVFDPQDGGRVVNRQEYLKDEMSEVWMALQIPVVENRIS